MPNVPGLTRLAIPVYAGTAFYKLIEFALGLVDTTAATANRVIYVGVGQYRSTSALTRVKVTPATGGSKFKVGTQLLIYKRIA